MTYSDEMMDSDNTTLIFPRYPDALPYVYNRSHTTQRSSTLPSSLPPHPTRRTAHPTKRERALISVPPYGTKIGENLMSVAATSRGEIALTMCMTPLRGKLHTTLEDINSYPAACLEELAVFMTKQACKDIEYHVRNAQEEAHEKRIEAFETAVQQIR
ncbi:hypothetical protein Tco_0049118, partial [Tanacetum coccineum]